MDERGRGRGKVGGGEVGRQTVCVVSIHCAVWGCCSSAGLEVKELAKASKKKSK